jgi:hypothetical protein
MWAIQKTWVQKFAKKLHEGCVKKMQTNTNRSIKGGGNKVDGKVSSETLWKDPKNYLDIS